MADQNWFCGGCGETDPQKRCLGCRHGMDDAGEDKDATIARLTGERDEHRSMLLGVGKERDTACAARDEALAAHGVELACRISAEAERDEARASLAAAPALWLEKAIAEMKRREAQAGNEPCEAAYRNAARAIRALMPADSAAALRTLRADAVREAAAHIKAKAESLWVDQRALDVAEDLSTLAHDLADRIEKGEA